MLEATASSDLAEGKMPNFARLAQEGSFRRLTTSIPPQSPVAWSNLITGMNAGGHGIFRSGGGQNAQLRPAGARRLLPAFDDQHSTPKSGSVVQSHHGYECWRPRHLPIWRRAKCPTSPGWRKKAPSGV